MSMQSSYTKCIRLEPTETMINFCDAQKNFSQSIRTLIQRYIDDCDGEICDVGAYSEISRKGDGYESNNQKPTGAVQPQL